MSFAITLIVEVLKWLFWDLKEKRNEAIEIEDSHSPHHDFWNSKRL